MITPAKHVTDKIFELDMPIEQFLPRQADVLKGKCLIYWLSGRLNGRQREQNG
jgi:hypothetical protein